MKGNAMDEAINAIDGLIKKIKPGTSTALRSAIVALYTADSQGELRYSNCLGLLQLDMDRYYKTNVLRLYNIETLTLVFEVQMYYGFIQNYKMINPTLYVFEYPRGLIGLLFKNKDDAQLMKAKIQTSSPSMKEYEEIKKKRIEEEKQKKKQGSFFNRVKRGLFGEEEKDKEISSVVVQVHKEKGISFDLQTGAFNTENIPPEWQELFDNLHLSNEDLKDKEVVNIIVEETIMQQMKQEAMKSMDKNLQLKLKDAEEEEKRYLQACRESKANGMPPPPPPPLLITPQNPQMQQQRGTMVSKRANLMEEIKTNNLKLKHVETSEKGINLDLTNMNRQDRMDHAERLRQKLKLRKKALNRREASDSDDSN